jgi:thiol-disulfide isomerase/thioredoxin
MTQKSVASCARVLALALLQFWGLAPDAGAAEPQPFVKGTYEAIRLAYSGQAVIVHIWGLSCGPCLAELPEWGKLAAAGSGVKLILINADRTDLQSGKRIADTLARAGLADAESYAFADRFEDRLRFEIDHDWQGELPRTVMISADGQTTTLSGVADMSMVRAWIEQTAVKGISERR